MRFAPMTINHGEFQIANTGLNSVSYIDCKRLPFRGTISPSEASNLDIPCRSNHDSDSIYGPYCIFKVAYIHCTSPAFNGQRTRVTAAVSMSFICLPGSFPSSGADRLYFLPA